MTQVTGAKYADWCMPCVHRARAQGVRFTMLTTYCLPALKCDGCGNPSDLAIVRIDKEGGECT